MDQTKNDLYTAIMKSTYEKIQSGMDDDSINFLENKRIYLCAFLSCLRNRLDDKMNDIHIEEKEENSEGNSENSTAIAIITFPTEEQFQASKSELLRYLSEKEYDSLFEIKEDNEETEVPDAVITEETEISETDISPTEPLESEPPEAVDENEEDIEATIENRKEITFDKVNTVETINNEESPVDYSKIKMEESKEETEEIQSTLQITSYEAPVAIISKVNYFADKYPCDRKNEKRLESFFYDKYVIHADDRLYKLFVYPLYYGISEPVSTNIFVAVKCDSGAYRGFISAEKGNKNIQAVIDDLKFLIRGRWMNDTFSSTLQLLKNADINIEKQEVRPVHPTSTTHMIIEKDNDRIHIYPTDFRNDKKTGTAGAVIYSEKSDSIFLPTPLTDIPYSKMHDNTIITYWIGNENPTLIWRDNET